MHSMLRKLSECIKNCIKTSHTKNCRKVFKNGLSITNLVQGVINDPHCCKRVNSSQPLISLMIKSFMITDTFLFLEVLFLLLMLFLVFKSLTMFFLLCTFSVASRCYYNIVTFLKEISNMHNLSISIT